MSKTSERGAVAVEFALLAPVLIMLLLGIMEFGRAYNAQIITLQCGPRRRPRHGNQQQCRPPPERRRRARLGTLNPALTDTKIIHCQPRQTCPPALKCP